MNRMIVAVIALAAVTAACGAQRPGAVDVRPAASSTAPMAKASCPATARQGYVAFPAAPATVLVPAGTTGGVACRYQNTSEPHPEALAKSAPLTAAQAARLAAALNSARVWPPGTVFNCPADFGGSDLIGFDYAYRGPVEVLVDTSGCGTASNGHRSAMNASAAIQQLASLVGTGPRP